MKIPKDSTELIKEIDATIDWRCGEYDMRDIVRLLDERFAFAGEVKLTREEATRIHYLVSGFRTQFKYYGYAMPEANCDEIMDIIGSKLAASGEENAKT